MTDVKEKAERILGFLESEKLAAVVMSLRRNFAWATGGSTNHVRLGSELGVSSLLFHSNGRRFIVAGNNEMPRMLEEEVAGLGFEPLEYDWHNPGQKLERIEQVAGGRPYGSDSPLGSAAVVEDRLARLRYRLTAVEVERYREVAAASAGAVEEVCRAIGPGTTETQIEAMAADALVRRGVRPTVLLVGVDNRLYRFRHPVPTERRLERYAMVAVNGQKYGLIASLTRFVHFGPPPEDLLNRHRAACRVFLEFMKHTRAGIRAADLFGSMQGWYAEAGFPDEWRYHHQGGAIGYREREWLLSPGLEERIESPQAFAWNPTIAGSKDEDTTLVHGDGWEVLTTTGQWPTMEIRSNGIATPRPAILVR